MRYTGVKGKVWEVVRKAIARRDGDNCYTCHRKGDGYSYDTGHYFPVAMVGSNNRLSWMPELIHRQCKYCNGAGQGMQVEYRKALVQDYGRKAVEGWEARRHKVDPIKDWNEVIEIFNAL